MCEATKTSFRGVPRASLDRSYPCDCDCRDSIAVYVSEPGEGRCKVTHRYVDVHVMPCHGVRVLSTYGVVPLSVPLGQQPG